ncbi:MAG: hypothetical protein LBE06_02525 [Azoarcus sp.]|nr:hypothetical protein [Azoarcus sp.]
MTNPARQRPAPPAESGRRPEERFDHTNRAPPFPTGICVPSAQRLTMMTGKDGKTAARVGLHGLKREFHSLKSEFYSSKLEVYDLKLKVYSSKLEFYSLKLKFYDLKLKVYSLKLKVYSQKPGFYGLKAGGFFVRARNILH